MEDSRIERFSQERLGGRPVPRDLQILLELAEQGAPSPLDDTGVRLLTSGEVDPMLDASYLNERDRADPDTMANIAAIAAVAAHIGAVAVHEDGDGIGYWFHPTWPADRPAPLVRWDHEGQFSYMEGDTFAGSVVVEWFRDEFDDGSSEEVADLVSRFGEVGIDIPDPSTGARDESFDEPPSPRTVDPWSLHDELYEEERRKRGVES